VRVGRCDFDVQRRACRRRWFPPQIRCFSRARRIRGRIRLTRPGVQRRMDTFSVDRNRVAAWRQPLRVRTLTGRMTTDGHQARSVVGKHVVGQEDHGGEHLHRGRSLAVHRVESAVSLARTGFKTRVTRGACPRTAHSGARRQARVTCDACAPEQAPVRGHPRSGFESVCPEELLNPNRGWRRAGSPARRGGLARNECFWPSTEWG
jgi:hypothetical protein